MKNLINPIYIRRRNKVLLPDNNGETPVTLNYVTTMVKNLEPLGYTFSKDLIDACTKLSLNQLLEFNTELVSELKTLRGAHRVHKPMYPNFPQQVMDMSETELYINAICHYWTGGVWTPPSDVKERFPLVDETKLTQLDLGDREDFKTLFTQLLTANTAWGVQDKEDVEMFIRVYREQLSKLLLLPEVIPQKENIASFAVLLSRYTDDAVKIVSTYCKTATDVLRIAVALSEGDVSLAQKTKFRTFSRKERVVLLELLNRVVNPVEDMIRWKGRWLRLGEKLHVGEYKTRFTTAYDAFHTLRNNVKVETFNSVVEKALVDKDFDSAVAKLSTRAGDYARRLDHVLRVNKAKQADVVTSFATVADNVSTPVLLQVMNHFKHRNAQSDLRTFFPKGSVAKATSIENTLPALPKNICNQLVTVCEDTLVNRFKALPSLGDCYLDKQLENYCVPFALRSASKSLRTLVRGSRVSFDDACEVLRFFCWWKDGSSRTDIDLSATMFDKDFGYIDVISYYNLKGFGGHHSGDITSAPQGASEFVDINIEKMLSRGSRYVVMTLNSYTNQPYCDLPECFAGWMPRQKANSGEIYEPRTVADRVDLTADSRIAIPMIIDLQERQVIWCDLSLKSNPNYQNNVHANLKSINATLQSFAQMKKPNLYDLFALHVKARGTLVKSAKKAKTVFSVENETPFRLEEIASEYMG